MADFVHHHKMVAWKSAFSVFSSARNQNELKRWARKWRVETSIFTNERGFELIRNLQTSSQSEEKNIKEEDGYDEKTEKIGVMVRSYTLIALRKEMDTKPLDTLIVP
jgi:hypothetical protein